MSFKRLSMSGRLSLLGISILAIVLDQVTKYLARMHLVEFRATPFLPHWNWTLLYNEGAAFSFLDNQNGWQKIFFAVVAALVSLGLIYYIMRKSYHWVAGIAFSFILGGALGNLTDRIIAGRVTDFIDWYVRSYHWPSFNLADSFVSVGVVLLIIESIFLSTHKK